MQSFSQIYEEGCPLCTMSNWGWHTTPFGNAVYKIDKKELSQEFFETNGRKVGYYTTDKEKEKYDNVRQNPHKYHLGKVGFVFLNENGNPHHANALENIEQELNLYTGVLSSSYDINNTNCAVQTCCHGEMDLIGIKAQSNLIGEANMLICLEFPYPSHETNGSDWENSNGHMSQLVMQTPNLFKIERTIDKERYCVYICGEDGFAVTQTAPHSFFVHAPKDKNQFNIGIGFFEDKIEVIPSCEQIFASSKANWKNYWENGGMVSFLKSTSKMAHELQRRVILSQYVTALQCGGAIPPAETGLTCNSWYGKFHLEMHFWNSLHFALFGRISKLEKSLQWYMDILDEAKALAKSQGYEGARWPKMVSREGIDSPSPIGPLLIWQQPHVLVYCDTCYNANPTRQTLETYQTLVIETANFMVSYAVYDEKKDRFVLGPPVIPVQERFAADKTLNPTFELEYWVVGLQIAVNWLEKMELPVPPKWHMVINKLAMPTIFEGVYVAHEQGLDTFANVNTDHPSMLMAYGLLNSKRINPVVMAKTYERVLATWDFESLWGWDFGVMAMTALMLDKPQEAIDILLKDTQKNTFLTNGHNQQSTRKDLPLYLPGNGALLLAVYMLTTGNSRGEEKICFACDDGSVEIEFENLSQSSVVCSLTF